MAPLVATSPGCGSPAQPSSALLVTLDATRADAVGTYGGHAPVTPHLDLLAREGITYAVARSVAPLTLPSHASMLTGLYPPRHGVRSNGPALVPTSADTLAEAARSAGCDTAAFVASRLLAEDTGLGQGFATWDGPVEDERSAEEVVQRAAGWLRGRPNPAGRFFLWVHLFDAHLPWNAPEPFVEQARGDAYLAEVARADAALGLLVEELRSLGLFERTAIAVVGDHGEPRGEHGERTHGHFVYEGALRVPFVIRPAAGGVGSERRGSADGGAASVADVAPTLARALGIAALPPGDGGDGIDGIDLLARPIPPERAVYFECLSGFLHLGWSPLVGWADARTKYIHSSEPELYLPDLWPDERVNRIHERSAEECDLFRARLEELASRAAAGDGRDGSRAGARPAAGRDGPAEPPRARRGARALRSRPGPARRRAQRRGARGPARDRGPEPAQHLGARGPGRRDPAPARILTADVQLPDRAHHERQRAGEPAAGGGGLAARDRALGPDVRLDEAEPGGQRARPRPRWRHRRHRALHEPALRPRRRPDARPPPRPLGPLGRRLARGPVDRRPARGRVPAADVRPAGRVGAGLGLPDEPLRDLHRAPDRRARAPRAGLAAGDRRAALDLRRRLHPGTAAARLRARRVAHGRLRLRVRAAHPGHRARHAPPGTVARDPDELRLGGAREPRHAGLRDGRRAGPERGEPAGNWPWTRASRCRWRSPRSSPPCWPSP